MQNEYQQLCEAIERQVERTMQTPLDFKWLSERIFERVHETISPTTLMRLWGYRTGVVPRQATLDIMARFLGYADFREFQDKSKETADSLNDQGINVEGINEGKRWKKRWWVAGLVIPVFVISSWWLFSKCRNTNTEMPAGAEDWTCRLRNPQCDTDSLDVWTFDMGGKPLEEDGTLTYFMKDFDVHQVVYGLPAGEYELRVRAWHLPCDTDKALYDYEKAEDKEEGTALSRAEIYAGPFAQRVKNYVSELDQENSSYENVLHFVVLEDSIRIGFRSDENWQRSCRAQADDFRLYLLRRATTEEDYRQMEAQRDSAQRTDDARPHPKTGDRIPLTYNGMEADVLYNYVKNGKVVNCWKGHEASLPEGWITEQEPNRCRLVHRTDVGRGMGDTDIYLEYRSDKPAKPGLLIGQRLFLEAGTYYLTAIFFAQGENEMPTNVSLAAKGYESSCTASSLMDWNYFPITLREAQEITVGLWAPEGCDVRRAGISALVVWAAKP